MEDQKLGVMAFVDLERILVDDDWNCRTSIMPLQIRELAKSIQEDGLVQPVVLAPVEDTYFKYRLVAGFRRYHAHKLLIREGRLKDPRIKALINEELVEPEKAMIINLTENLHRQDLNMVEEARAIQKLYESGVRREDIASKINKSSGWVQERCMVLEMPECVQNEIALGWVPSPILRDLYSVLKKQGETACVRACKVAKEAKERGERVTLVKRKPKPFARKKRNHAELNELMNLIYTKFGLETEPVTLRVLAWALGNTTDYELMCLLHARAEQINNDPSIAIEEIVIELPDLTHEIDKEVEQEANIDYTIRQQLQG